MEDFEIIDTIPLENHGMFVGEIGKYIDEKSGEVRYFAGLGTIGCLYDSFVDDFEFIEDAVDYILDYASDLTELD